MTERRIIASAQASLHLNPVEVDELMRSLARDANAKIDVEVERLLAEWPWWKRGYAVVQHMNPNPLTVWSSGNPMTVATSAYIRVTAVYPRTVSGHAKALRRSVSLTWRDRKQ